MDIFTRWIFLSGGYFYQVDIDIGTWIIHSYPFLNSHSRAPATGRHSPKPFLSPQAINYPSTNWSMHNLIPLSPIMHSHPMLEGGPPPIKGILSQGWAAVHPGSRQISFPPSWADATDQGLKQKLHHRPAEHQQTRNLNFMESFRCQILSGITISRSWQQLCPSIKIILAWVALFYYSLQIYCMQ